MLGLIRSNTVASDDIPLTVVPAINTHFYIRDRATLGLNFQFFAVPVTVADSHLTTVATVPNDVLTPREPHLSPHPLAVSYP